MVVQFEVASPSRSDSAPELERKMRSLAMEKLRMEKLITKLYSVRVISACGQGGHIKHWLNVLMCTV